MDVYASGRTRADAAGRQTPASDREFHCDLSASDHGGAGQPEYDPFYCFAGGTEEEFFDPEHDQIVEFYEEGGLIHSTSQFDEMLSKQYIEENLGLEYAGQAIRSKIVVDAETCDVLENREMLVQDGEETVVFETIAAYDTPEPVASRALRAGFERPSENLMTVTFVVDAGTDHEFSRDLTVPANTEAG